MPKWAIVTFEKSFQVVVPDDATEEQAIQSAIKYHDVADFAMMIWDVAGRAERSVTG